MRSLRGPQTLPPCCRPRLSAGRPPLQLVVEHIPPFGSLTLIQTRAAYPKPDLVLKDRPSASTSTGTASRYQSERFSSRVKLSLSGSSQPSPPPCGLWAADPGPPRSTGVLGQQSPKPIAIKTVGTFMAPTLSRTLAPLCTCGPAGRLVLPPSPHPPAPRPPGPLQPARARPLARHSAVIPALQTGGGAAVFSPPPHRSSGLRGGTPCSRSS